MTHDDSVNDDETGFIELGKLMVLYHQLMTDHAATSDTPPDALLILKKPVLILYNEQQ